MSCTYKMKTYNVNTKLEEQTQKDNPPVDNFLRIVKTNFYEIIFFFHCFLCVFVSFP